MRPEILPGGENSLPVRSRNCQQGVSGIRRDSLSEGSRIRDERNPIGKIPVQPVENKKTTVNC